MQKQRFSPIVQSFIGGALAGSSLSYGSAFLMPFGLALLWASIRSPFSGFAWGCVAVLLSHRWILNLHPLNWIGVPSLLSIPIAISIWLVCGLLGSILVGFWTLLANYVYYFSLDRSSFKRNFFYVIILSSLWGLVEVFLAKGPFFWIGLGSSLLPGDRALAGLARWLGGGGLAFIQLLIGWWVWQLIIAWPRKIYWRRLLIGGFTLLFCLHIIGWSLLTQESYSSNLSAAIWQTDIPIRDKFSRKQLQQLPQSVEIALGKAKNLGASLLLAPEGTLFTNQRLSSPAPIAFFSGGFRQVNGDLRNSLLFFRKGQSEFSKALDKYRLVPLGESTPSFLDKLPFKSLSAIGRLKAGHPSRLFNWGGPSFATAICYEISDGSALSRAAFAGSQWILALSNLDPYPILLQKQFLANAQLRSIETGRDLISVANTGPSALIKSSGKIKMLLPSFKEEVALAEIQLSEIKTGYIVFREWTLFAIFAIGLTGQFFYRK
tara:strand:+ start:26443 stop:27915 length:1473 start_codon:yes stop_codon:yes gene_type:complete